ncbi:hypothetical protein K1719_010863 [Acacia pycnantha]|nr:hypothetical protein K1719_010863 [Acacia pycnantha]
MHILRVWVDRLQQTLSQHPKLRVIQSIETPSLTFPTLGLPFGKTSVRMFLLSIFTRLDHLASKEPCNDANFRNNEVECTLFDNCASNAYMAYLQNTESPVVVLLNFARVGFSEDGTPQVCSSFNATRALFNPSITKVKNLIQSAKDEKSLVMGALSQPITSQLSQHLNGASLHNQTKITISQIPEQAIGIVERVDAQNDCSKYICESCGEGVTPPVTPLEDSSVSDISQHVTPAPVKGKEG